MSDVRVQIFKGEREKAKRKTFASIIDALKFASDLVSNKSSESNPLFCELRTSKLMVILQCQDPGYFLQVFREACSDEGWLTVVETRTDLALENEIVIACHEDDEDVAETHFRLIGIEGAWVSKALLCNRDLLGQGLIDLMEYASGAPGLDPEYWIDVGLM